MAAGGAASPRRSDAIWCREHVLGHRARPIKAPVRLSERSRGKIRSARIVVTGCYATRRPDEVADLPGVVQIVPNDRKDHLVAEIGLAAPKPEWAKAGLTTAQRFGDGEGACGADIAPGLAGRTAFTLRVQTGCDQTCSYCIIPSTRGMRPQQADARGVCQRSTASAMRAIARSRLPACILARTAAISATGRRCWSC